MQKKIMILGGTGLLGKCLIKTCQINKQKYVTAGRNNCDMIKAFVDNPYTQPLNSIR